MLAMNINHPLDVRSPVNNIALTEQKKSHGAVDLGRLGDNLVSDSVDADKRESAKDILYASSKGANPIVAKGFVVAKVEYFEAFSVSNLKTKALVKRAGNDAETPSFYSISGKQSENVHKTRSISPPSKPKEFVGVNRVNQVLRHVATAIYTDAKNSDKQANMVEVQCSFFDGKLHISSNFHHSQILPSLESALSQQKTFSSLTINTLTQKTRSKDLE